MAKQGITSERAFEDLIVAQLCGAGGFELGDNQRWSQELALDRTTLIEFVQATQPEQWAQLRAIHGDDAERRFVLRLHRELDNRGTLDVLRHGIIDHSIRIQLAFFQPANELNPETRQRYNANRLLVYRQLHHSERNPSDSIDVVLGLNGLPVATIELKNQFTGQSVAEGRQQYSETRDPREPLFAFKRRALVHFVVDADEVWMTTRLSGRDTLFLPFNQGQRQEEHTAAGNPPNPNGHRTAYLWERILAKDSWMEILSSFAHLQRDEIYVGGRALPRETLIFPRYHQIDAVRAIIADVRERGIGRNYLIQHSAGSGKSNTIAWLAHALARLHDANNLAVYDSVVVVSDRRVLDRQLQDTVFQFEHRQGVVVKIDRDSQQLADALTYGAQIIITTLQKFPFVVDEIAKLPTRRYAVIVDEAHSSQSGEAADALRGALAERPTAYRENSDHEPDYQDVMVEKMAARKAAQRNLSFFAFTATPKPRTLKDFGTSGPDGKPCAFHLYSMRQAIEERFILNVLQQYISYEVYYKVAKKIVDDPHLEKRQAALAIARYVRLHPHAVAQKVEIIIEHFCRVVAAKIGGEAKAMIVTSGRLDAVRYKHEVDRYLQEKDYKAIKALVAFSGSVRDEDDVEYSERQMNGFDERELAKRFASDEYRLLLVADKYQTGFDQPLLHTMYVDKKLSGVRAVQTLSRLNRIYPGKDDTFVLDFANDPEVIRQAFEPYYSGTTLESEIDPNQLYDIRYRLLGYDVLRESEIEEFARVFFQPRQLQTSRDHAALNSALDPAVSRFRKLRETESGEFVDLLESWLHRYSFLAQIIPFSDAELEKLYVYGRLLSTKIGNASTDRRLQIQDEVALEYYRLQKMTEGELVLDPSSEAALRVPGDSGGREEDIEAALSTIVAVLNERFGTAFTPADQLFVDQIELHLASDTQLERQAKSNSMANFSFPFEDSFDTAFIERMEQNQEFVDRVMSEDRFRDIVYEDLLRKVYERLRGE